MYYGNPILMAAAVIPAIFLLIQVYKADRLEKEPTRLLVSLVFLGILSTLIAVILEEIGQYLISPLDPNSFIYNFILYYIIVGYAEEWGKYIMLKRRTWKNPAFNCQFDGVVYAVYVSLGFALWENIQYVSIYGLTTALVRAVTAVPGHACFGVFMGIFYGMAKRYEFAGDSAQSKRYRLYAVVVPAFIHGTYDFTATMGGGATLAFFIFIAIIFFIASRLVKNMAMNDKYIGFPGRNNY